MTVLSPMLTTIPLAVPSTALVEKKAKFLKYLESIEVFLVVKDVRFSQTLFPEDFHE
jgi:hypothetical protein